MNEGIMIVIDLLGKISFLHSTLVRLNSMKQNE